MSASFKETSLPRITADLASMFRSAIEKGGVKYVVDMEGSEHPVWIDRDMWEVSPSSSFSLRKSFSMLLEMRSNSRYLVKLLYVVDCHPRNDICYSLFRIQERVFQRTKFIGYLRISIARMIKREGRSRGREWD
jgi:hypothetical protein